MNLPANTALEISFDDNILGEDRLDSGEGAGLDAWFNKYAGTVESPEDWSTQNDHYRLGTPKR